jgi:hypothetical protein
VLCAFALGASAQSDIWRYSKTGTGNLTVTIQLPSSGASQQVELMDYTLQCTADCTVSTERNGSQATQTAGVWRCQDFDTCPKNGSTPIQPATKVYEGSNSTGGSALDEPYVFIANALIPWMLTGTTLTNFSANWTIKVVGTGTYHFQLRARIRR